MGWRFRRSKAFGPFRVTASKSGVGASVGVKGARIGVGGDGRHRTTFSVPGTGISHQTTWGSRQNAQYPTRRSTNPIIAIIAILAGAASMLVGSCVLITLFRACNPAPVATRDDASAVDAGRGVDAVGVVADICRRLNATGFAASCSTPIGGGVITTLDFELNVGPESRGRITFDQRKDAGAAKSMIEADYPELYVSSIIGLTIERTDKSSDAAKWAQCVHDRSQAIAPCAKKTPYQYAWFHAFYDEAKRIVEGLPDPTKCASGYLCGTRWCTPQGDTCCIDVNHPERSCPGGGACTASAGCIGGIPQPQSQGLVSGGSGGSGGCTCNDGTPGCCGRGCCSHHGGIR